MGLKSIFTKPAYYVSDNSLLLQIGCRGVSPVLGFTRTTQYIPKSTTDPEWCLPFSTYPYLFLLMIFQTNFFRLIMSALKFHLPTSWTGILWNKASFVECLAHANGGPWSTPMWLLTSACIERFLSTSFTKLSHIKSHIWTQTDHLLPCLKEDHYDCDEDGF